MLRLGDFIAVVVGILSQRASPQGEPLLDDVPLLVLNIPSHERDSFLETLVEVETLFHQEIDGGAECVKCCFRDVSSKKRERELACIFFGGEQVAF